MDTKNIGFQVSHDDFDKLEVYHDCLEQSMMNYILAGVNNVDEAISVIKGMFEDTKVDNAKSSRKAWNDFESSGTLGTNFVENMDRSFVTSAPSDFYPWSDESLIENILTGMNNITIDVASSSTEAMLNSGNEFESFCTQGSSFEEGMDINFITGVPSAYEEDESFFEDLLAGLIDNVDVDSSLIEAIFGFEVKHVGAKKSNSDLSDFESFGLQGTSSEGKTDNNFHPWDNESLIEDILCAGGSDYVTSSLIEALFNSENDDINSEKVDSNGDNFIPFEMEQDDVYMVHRKDAQKATRSAIHHSKAAKDASIKGDHISARRYRLMAREEWAMAKKLHAKAAKKIQSVKNHKNDVWTLDLHGLHAREAVDALRCRLKFVESFPQESGLLAKMEMLGKHKQICLKAITGKGNHSKGPAVLPSAIRNFLNENGYQFDDSRSGSFMICPKFREQ